MYYYILNYSNPQINILDSVSIVFNAISGKESYGIESSLCKTIHVLQRTKITVQEKHTLLPAPDSVAWKIIKHTGNLIS